MFGAKFEKIFKIEPHAKKAKGGELLIYEEVLNKIADQYNPIFSRLKLPESNGTNKNHSKLLLTHYEGETFNKKWTEETGGLLLGLDLSTEVPEMLYDLSKIKTSVVLDNKRLQSIPKLIFNTTEFIPEFESIARRLLDSKILKKEEIELARTSIKKEFTSPLMVNNGDFYPRNFIRQPDKKIILIDWETWNANSRANIVDHPENIAAFCFVHMWNNEPWQKNYVTELQKRFSMKEEDFQRALLIKSIEMANFWLDMPGRTELYKDQIKIFRNALNPEYMRKLWFP